MKTIFLPPYTFNRDWFGNFDRKRCSLRSSVKESVLRHEEYGRYDNHQYRSYSYAEQCVIFKRKLAERMVLGMLEESIELKLY